MDEVQITITCLAVALVACVGLWLYGVHADHVSEVVRCERSGGVAVIAARGYACFTPAALQAAKKATP